MKVTAILEQLLQWYVTGRWHDGEWRVLFPNQRRVLLDERADLRRRLARALWLQRRATSMQGAPLRWTCAWERVELKQRRAKQRQRDSDDKGRK